MRVDARGGRGLRPERTNGCRTLILCGAREQPAKLIYQAEFEEIVGRENICDQRAGSFAPRRSTSDWKPDSSRLAGEFDGAAFTPLIFAIRAKYTSCWRRAKYEAM